MSNKALVWVRDDFRINNNDALIYASNNHDLVTVVFIFNNNTNRPPKGDRSEGFCIKILILIMFHQFRLFFLEITILYIGNSGGWC